jgi:hypothetical protein
LLLDGVLCMALFWGLLDFWICGGGCLLGGLLCFGGFNLLLLVIFVVFAHF